MESLTWWSIREAQLSSDTESVHISEGSRIDWQGTRTTENEHHGCSDERGDKMKDAVRDPGQHIEKSILVSGEDIAQICAIEDVFESGKDADVDWRSVCAINESVKRLLAMFCHAPALPP